MGQKNNTAYLDFRLSPVIKDALDQYCENHFEKTTEAINNAIKNLVGFGKSHIKMETRQFDKDKGKTIRLNIRTHPLLKESLEEYCRNNGVSFTDAITNAIKMYIRFPDSHKH